MKKYIFFLVGLCCALLPAMADQPELLELKASDANIIGHVLDKKTGEHLSYITIALKGTTIGTVTDATGHYFLKNLPEGNFVLEASSVGYKTISRNVSLRKGKTLEENFELEEDAVALDGVVVSANRSVTKRRLAPTLVNVVDMKMFENTNSRDAYDHDGDGYSEMPKLKNQTVGFRSFLKTSTYSKLTFEYHHLQEFRRGGNLLNRPPHEADIAEQIQHSINGGGLKFDYFAPNEKHRLTVYTSAQHTDRDSYYGSKKDQNAYGKTTDLTFIGGSQYVYSFGKCLFMPADLTAGLEYNRDNLKDDMWGYNRYTKQTVNIGSAFLQNEWKNEKWSILLGGRLDKHNLINHVIFSPRANLRFNPSEDINLRLSYSSGFRAPQAFDEDLHIENVGGTVSMIERAKNLKEEKSQSFSASADMYHRFGAFQVNFLVEGFYTRLSDVFVLENIGERDGILIKERRNGSGAKVLGLSMEGKMAYLSLFQLQAGVTLQQSRYDEPEKWSETAPAEKKIFRTPNTYGYFTATYTPIKPLSLSLSGTYTGSMLVQHMAGYIDKDVAVNTRDFFDMGVKVAYDFKLYKSVDLQLSAGVQNVFNAYQNDFDQGVERDSGYIYGPAAPRSYFAGIKISY